MSGDETDRLIAALDVGERLPDEEEARHKDAVDRAVTAYKRRMAGLDPHGAMDALEAARRAWERAHEAEQKAA